MAKIVLVEDDAAAEALIRQYVEQLPGGHELVVFPSASPALDWARDHSAGLFILDIQLPDYRGTELGRQLRALSEHRFTPILFTTELAGEELAAYREIKCYDFLVKPFTQAQFSRAVTDALELGARLAPAPAILRVEQKQFIFEYEMKNILYIESFGKRAVIHSTAGDRVLSDPISGYSLARLLELAGPGGLVQCHKSYLINPARLSRIDKRGRQLWLTGCADSIPIGEKFQDNLRAQKEGRP